MARGENLTQIFTVVVSAIIFNDRGEVLLGKRSLTEEIYPGLWGIPGGKIEASSSTPDIVEATLIREAREEMAIEIQPEYYVASSCKISQGEAKLYLLYTARWLTGMPQALEDTEEVGWFSVSELSKLTLTPHTHQHILGAQQKYK